MVCSTDNLKGENNYSFYVFCRKSCFEYTFVTDTLIVGVAHRSLNGVEGVISDKIKGQPSRQIVPTFATRISSVFSYLETPGDESGNY